MYLNPRLKNSAALPFWYTVRGGAKITGPGVLLYRMWVGPEKLMISASLSPCFLKKQRTQTPPPGCTQFSRRYNVEYFLVHDRYYDICKQSSNALGARTPPPPPLSSAPPPTLLSYRFRAKILLTYTSYMLKNI